MPLSSIYSFQESSGITAHMFRAVAKVTSLVSLPTQSFRAGGRLAGSVHTRVPRLSRCRHVVCPLVA